MSSIPPLVMDLLLVGKTGHGKSASGNSILGRYEFDESDGGEAATFMIREAWTELQNFVVKVVDGPGVGDTRLTTLEDAESASKNFSEAMFLCTRGFHALLLVYRYGVRFTNEEKAAINMMKGLFGENVVRDYCICIMTHGDTFKAKHQRAGHNKTFMTWCREQGGDLAELLEECEYRCVLFDNLTDDSQVKDRQRLELFSLVDGLRYRGVRYTNENFQEAHKQRERLVVEKKAPQLKEEISKRTSLLLGSLIRVQEAEDNFEEADREIRRLEQNVEKLLQEIEREDKGTGVLTPLKDSVTPIQKTIERHALMVELQKQGKLEDEERNRQNMEMIQELNKQAICVKTVHARGKDWERVAHYAVEALKVVATAVLLGLRLYFRV